MKGELTKPVYSTTSPLEKPSSDHPPLRRTVSAPCTIQELVLQELVLCSSALDPEWTADKLRASRDSIRATHGKNRSLKHVCDPRMFWKAYAREKMNQVEGNVHRKRSSSCAPRNRHFTDQPDSAAWGPLACVDLDTRWQAPGLGNVACLRYSTSLSSVKSYESLSLVKSHGHKTRK